MARRRSLRRYSGEPIPQALLDRILEAGLRSASGRSRRPWELIVVRDRATLDALSECREQGAAMLTGADAAIVVVADPTLADTWVEDCSIVMANMQLEAAASGVGSCWIQGRLRQAADGRSTHEFVANLLKVPAPYQLEAILSLGMPEAEAPRRPFDEALLGKVHEERF
ncbi:nitroreductase family protein [uncultured Adlercreutzia sp.]|uniref:nitroreductase family protein n=1 Tax=uncultured Adlercreutzia sp. TaxID=875803 RepID=UPI00338E64F3